MHIKFLFIRFFPLTQRGNIIQNAMIYFSKEELLGIKRIDLLTYFLFKPSRFTDMLFIVICGKRKSLFKGFGFKNKTIKGLKGYNKEIYLNIR